jgi:hypothetical protein
MERRMNEVIIFDLTSRMNGNPWEESNDPLWLLTPGEFNLIPDGTVFTSIIGEKKVKGRDDIDMDTRGPYIAWGLLESQLSLPKTWID